MRVMGNPNFTIMRIRWLRDDLAIGKVGDDHTVVLARQQSNVAAP